MGMKKSFSIRPLKQESEIPEVPFTFLKSKVNLIDLFLCTAGAQSPQYRLLTA